MPIYEFKCGECGAEFELLLKSKEEIGEVSCKVCGSLKVERLMSIVNSLFGNRSNSSSNSDRPKVAETHNCPSGTCTHLELPGYRR